MSVRLPPPPRQPRHRDTSRGLSVAGSARDLSRLSLVLAAGRRELATAAINDAKRQRIEARQARDAAREEEERANELKALVEEKTLVWLVERQARVESEIALYESGLWTDEEVYQFNKAESAQLEEAIRIKEGRQEQDAAIAAAAAAAEEERKAEEKRKLAERVAENRRRKQEAEEAAERAREAAEAAGRHPNQKKALEDPYHWQDYLKSKADRQWWKTKGQALAGRLNLASHHKQALLDAWRRWREADEAALAANPELGRWRARYEEILTIVTSLDDEDEKVRDAAWLDYVQIAPEEMEAFHAHNLWLIAVEQEVEQAAEKAAKKAALAALNTHQAEVAEAKAQKVAEDAEIWNVSNAEKREAERIAKVAADKAAEKAEKDAATAARRAARAAEKQAEKDKENAARRAAREKENAARPPGKRRAPQ